MKPSAFFVNTSRGPVVDQEALVEVLRARRIAGAALDVTTPEPLPADHPLTRLDNVILAPHSLCATDQCFADVAAADANAVLQVMHGNAPRNVVNRGVLENPAWTAKLASLRQRFGGG
jgi:phosphoglycerate dehydrogenase-like enzyme